MNANGRWIPVEPGETFTCRCGAVKDGERRGRRGGRVWTWETGGERFCQPRCPAIPTAEDERMMDEAKGDWEADQAEARYA